MHVPGAPNPLLMAGGLPDPLDEFGTIDYALRFNSADSARLTWTPGVAPASTKIATIGFCLHRSALKGSAQRIYGHDQNADTDQFIVSIDSSERLVLAARTLGTNTLTLNLVADALLRDAGNFIFGLVHIDTTQAVATDRAKLWINGVEYSLASATYPAQNTDFNMNRSGVAYDIGRNNFANSAYLDGYLAQVFYVDGAALTPDSFGAFHPRTNQWRPKSREAVLAVVDAGGANSFMLEFANSASLGLDSSANGNNFTPVNLAATDQVISTPTDCFAVLDPLDTSNGLTLNGLISDGGLTLTASSSGIGTQIRRCTQRVPQGNVVYMEVEPQNLNRNSGLRVINDLTGDFASIGTTNTGDDWVTNVNGTLVQRNAVIVGDTGQLMIDTATGNVWLGVNDVWYDNAGGTTGDPDNLLNPTGNVPGLAASLTVDATVFYASAAPNASVIDLDFGQKGFTRTKPTPAVPLSTKNLPFPAIERASDAFVAVTDVGATIAATLAAAAPAMSEYCEMFKRRDVAEGWRWRWSDDLANYLDSSSTAAKAAFPTLVAGGQYVGYRLRKSVQNGVWFGTVAHVNGVATTVTHNLGRNRCAILLKREDNTSDWPLYHPDLTAGNLLKLNTPAAQAALTDITNVTPDAFDIGAGVATGTYRYMVLGEVDGFLSLSSYTGNGSADGPFTFTGLSSLFFYFKRLDLGTHGIVYDAERSVHNPTDDDLKFSLTDAETVNNSVVATDANSNGLKLRGSNVGVNNNGSPFITIAIAEYAQRYANGR